MSIHNDINVSLFVIPGLTRNPVFSWIPASAGMTSFVVINDAVYNKLFLFLCYKIGKKLLKRVEIFCEEKHK
ncbi:MAG: hypothetical protein A2157_04855 [Deltaproteobacteria bacterium RBG_16_47_11]|nr:MAG: hypothetical protein A2157_04855 [Deltaproteobacteria bacterium RBG_16_47_11]